MKERLPLLMLSAILLPLSCRLAVAAGGQASTESPASPPSSSQVRWEDVVSKKGDTRVLCRKILPPDSAFECNNIGTLDHQDASTDDGIINISVNKKSDKGLSNRLLLFQAPEMEVRRRRIRGWTLQKTNRLKSYPKVAEVYEHADFFYVVITKISGISREFFSHQLVADYSKELTPKLAIDSLEQAVEMLKGLHKAGNVAINHQIVLSNTNDDEFSAEFYALDWMVKAGEEVGRFPFDPILTDPVALKDPTFKADIALDYYVLGIWILNALYNFPKKTRKIPLEFPAILENKKKNLLVFPQESPTALAFLVAWWTQDNREARTSVEIWKELWAYLGSVSKLDTLETAVTYSTTEDPLKVPAFQNLLDSLYLPSLRPEKGQQSTAGQPATSPEASTSHRTLFWVGIVSAGLLILIIGIWLVCRRSHQAEDEALETRKTLQATGTEEPTVSV